MVLPCLEAHWSILERRTRLKRKRTRPDNTNKQNKNNKQQQQNLWGAQVYLCS